MMRNKAVVVLVVLSLFASSAGSASAQNWLSGSFEDAQAKGKASGKLLLLDFFQEYG